jgi:hypothetical protein
MQLMAPLGGVVRPRRAVRFARLIDRRVRAFGGPTVRAAFAGNLNLPCLPRWVVLMSTGPALNATALKWC